MLSPEDRSLYSDCLEPPEGYRFDSGVATTFTLNLETLLVLPFTLAMKRATDPEALLSDPVALLEALRETSDRLSVFCHDGYIAVPPKQHLLYSYLEDCVIPARAGHAHGIFHPKLWLLRFIDDDDRPLLRAVVLSRNLTFDPAWDTVTCLEGEPGRRTRDSYGLADLVDALPNLAVRAPDPQRLELIARLADEARHTRFAAPEPFTDHARFHAIGVDGRAFEPELEGWGSRVLCVSPFLSAPAIEQADEYGREEWTLVSREDQLDACSPETLEGWKRYQLADDVETGDTADTAERADDTVRGFAKTPSGLHAKLFVVEDGQGRVTWWIGSANLTDSAWSGRNVELMVELHGARRHVGIDAFLDAGFGKLLTEYERSEPSPEAAAQQAAIDLADEARRVLVNSALELRCDPNGDAFDLRLDGDVTLPDGVRVRVWPLSLAESTHSRPLADLPLTWPALAPASLTSLVAVELTATLEATATVRFTLKLPTANLPDDRHAHILRQLVDSRAGFFRYLRFLLAAAGNEPVADLLRADAESNGKAGRRSLLDFEHAVLEDLLRATSRDPGRLDAIACLLEDLSQTEEGRALIPDDFAALFATLRAARSADATAARRR